MDVRDRIAGGLIVAGLLGLFAGTWLAFALGVALIVTAAVLLLLGVALGVIESEVVGVEDEPEVADTELPERTVVRMRSPIAVLPRRRREA